MSEHNRKTFADFDKFGRKEFADRLTKVIKAFYPLYEESFVLSLNAPFGRGKTTFVEMWKSMLEEEHGIETIYVNAWEHDFDDEPIMPILSSIIEHIGNKPSKKDAFFTAMGATFNGIIANKTGANFKEIIKEVAEESDIRNAGERIYEQYCFKQKAFKDLKEKCLPEYIKSLNNKPLVIFVDELDRARPDYALKFLETIKHIFPVQGVCFVLSIDKEQLEKSIKQIYGAIDFENYYLRFITREATLPELKNIDLEPFVTKLSKDFFDEKENKGIIIPIRQKDKSDIIIYISYIVKFFGFEARQIKALFRIFTQFIAIEDENRTGKPVWIKASIILIALSLKNNAMYHKIGNDKISVGTSWNYVISIDSFSNDDNMSYNFKSTFISFLLNINTYKNDKDSIVQILKTEDIEVGSISITMGMDPTKEDKSGFQEIYDLLENWKEFIK